MATILVVDDSRLSRSMAADALREAGHTVVEAQDGREGIDAFNNQEFDCVVTDLVMPEVDGLRLVHHIRGFDRRLPVVVVSADVQDSTSALCRKLGSTDFLNKPVKMSHLQEVVDRALARARGDQPCA
jgi:two-component system, chemotaxis family, chemotaxis protein CheY